MPNFLILYHFLLLKFIFIWSLVQSFEFDKFLLKKKIKEKKRKKSSKNGKKKDMGY